MQCVAGLVISTLCLDFIADEPPPLRWVENLGSRVWGFGVKRVCEFRVKGLSQP